MNLPTHYDNDALEDKAMAFTSYLADKTLTIELIDSDSHFVFGLAKLPLNVLTLNQVLQSEQDEMPYSLTSKALEIDICETS